MLDKANWRDLYTVAFTFEQFLVMQLGSHVCAKFNNLNYNVYSDWTCPKHASIYIRDQVSNNLGKIRGGGGGVGGVGVLTEKLGGGVRPASQNPYPISDQNLRFSLPYFRPDQKFDTLFQT